MIECLHRISMARMRRAARAVLAGVITGCAGLASAGYVTTFEAGMDAIFSQSTFASFGNIDIRINPAITVAAANLLSLDSNEEFFALSALRGNLASNTVSVFFVDAIPFCGSVGSNIIGCGDSLNLIALKSSAAASTGYGANLLAHELGHNLDLDHFVGSNNNLMNPIISNFSFDGSVQPPVLGSGSFLNLSQVATIFARQSGPGSPFNNQIIQSDSSGYFISITPYAVVAAVPEPQTWLMMGMGLLGILAWVRRPRPVAWRAA
jgi:hypothetical protein